ncbi:hypothetical protein RRG08_043770 [Elysia crispata]|uniref:HTH OST-type domain-containing protein n=1 Tax=Elysia crispata TaxID=231223 RepID=A0AAE1B970_9GAST|nr:hypothetical protein RRG08_043770 [Elysia crispata]
MVSLLNKEGAEPTLALVNSSRSSMSSQVPEEIKRNVRAVLLSKVGGVPMGMFIKDYKSLVLAQLDYRGLGFQTLQAFFKSIPEIASYCFWPLSVGARKAQGKLPKDYHKKLQASQSSDSEESSFLDMELSALEPDHLGWYSLCCPIQRAPSLDKMELESLFGQAGSEVKTHLTQRWLFVRYKSKEECKKALNIFGEDYGLCVASKQKSTGSVIDEGTKNPQKSDKKPNGCGPKGYRDKGKNSGYMTDADDRKKPPKTESKLNGHSWKGSTQENGNKMSKKEKIASSTSLFVHGISDKEAFMKLIEPYKPVEIKFATYYRGWLGFLEMETAEEAKIVIADLHQKQLGDRYIIVDYDTEKENKKKKDANENITADKESSSSTNKKNIKSPQKPEFPDMPTLVPESSATCNPNYYMDCTVFVGNFPAKTTFVALQEVFSKYHVKDMIIGNTSALEGCTRAYLYLSTINDVIQCVEEMNNYVMGDCSLKVDVPYKNEKMRFVLKNRLQLRMLENHASKPHY